MLLVGPKRTTRKKRDRGSVINVYCDPSPLVRITVGSHHDEGMHSWRRITARRSHMDRIVNQSNPSGVPSSAGAVILVSRQGGSNRLY